MDRGGTQTAFLRCLRCDFLIWVELGLWSRLRSQQERKKHHRLPNHVSATALAVSQHTDFLERPGK